MSENTICDEDEELSLLDELAIANVWLGIVSTELQQQNFLLECDIEEKYKVNFLL